MREMTRHDLIQLVVLPKLIYYAYRYQNQFIYWNLQPREKIRKKLKTRLKLWEDTNCKISAI